MNDLNANSYDLSDAQLMLDELLPKHRSMSAEKKTQAVPNKYLNLSSFDVSPRKTTEKSVVQDGVKESEEQDTALKDFDAWEDIIAWCMTLTRAETGFVVDSQGFVIASRGRIPGQGIEGVGAELVCSIDQLERIDPDAGRLLNVEIELDKRRLVGFVTGVGEQNVYVVGLIASEPLNSSIKHKILHQITNNLPNLD